MPSRKSRIIGLSAILLLVVIVYYVSVAFRPIHQVTQLPRHYTGHNVGHIEKKNETFLDKMSDDPVAAFTLVLVIFTGLLWWSTRTLVKDTRAATNKQLRAYLSVKIIGISKENPDAPLAVRFRIINAGVTPAIDVCRTTKISVLDYPLPRSICLVESLGSEKFVVHRGIPVIGTQIRVSPLSPEDITGIRSGHKRLYIHGSVTYKDVFDEQRYTNFCVSIVEKSFADWYESVNAGEISSLRATWHYADIHNEIS